MNKKLTLATVMLGFTSLLSPLHAQTEPEKNELSEQVENQTQLSEMQKQEQLKRQLILLNQQLKRQQQAVNQMAQKVFQQSSPQQVQPSGHSQPSMAAIAEEDSDVKKTPDRGRSTEDILQETHTVFTRRFTIEPSITYGYYSRKDLILKGFLALDAIFLGNINLDRIRASTVQIGWTTRYTLNEKWQMELDIPFVYRLSQYDSVGDGNSSSQYETKDIDGSNLGDISAGFYYHLKTETKDRPDWVWNVKLRVPTGRDPFGIELETSPSGNLTVPTEIATGAGVWGASTGFSLAKSYDPAIVFFNLNYGWNFTEKFEDLSGEPGLTPGEIDLGDYLDYSVGLAFAVSEKMSIAMSFNQRFYGKTSQKLEGQPEFDIPRSDTNTANLGFGATLALSDALSMVTSVSAGLTEDSPDYQISLRFPYRF
ncbi:MAG: hypothetical protein ACI86X_000860 [Moritella sp.]|jgi:hypothetical protein